MIPLLLALWAYHTGLGMEGGTTLRQDSTLAQEGCTVGVVSAGSTADGRPLLWKIRDNTDLPNNSVSYDATLPLHFLGVTNSDGCEPWMGVNEKGFAIINSTALDLPGGTSGLTNGALMRIALGTCASVNDFTHLLDSTNTTGRRTQSNFGVIDAMGAAVMIEVGGSGYWRFDANDPVQSPGGYVLRTNFSVTGGGTTGIERYRRTVCQIREFALGDTLEYRRIIRYHTRDFSDQNGNSVQVPYAYGWPSGGPPGYINSSFSVCRCKSIAAAAIVGVKTGELPMLSTMWTILGQPASGIAVPYWPVGDPPAVARGDTSSPLYDIATKIRSLLFDFSANHDYVDSYKLRDDCGNGLWGGTFQVEDSMFNEAEALLGQWRKDFPTGKSILKAENAFASFAVSQLDRSYLKLVNRVVLSVANDVPYGDENGKTLENGDIIQLIWAGEDGRIDPPNMVTGNPEWGNPTNDDRMIGVLHFIGENLSSKGLFRFQVIGWPGHTIGWPGAGDFVYARAFNEGSLEKSTRFGDAQLHQVSMNAGQSYTPLIEGGRTTQSLKGLRPSAVASSRLRLSPNYPNPFNSSTIIEFVVPRISDGQRRVDLTVFNTLGETVKSLFVGTSSGGSQRLEWDGRDDGGEVQPSGVYFVGLNDGSATTIRKMVLLK